MLRYHVYCPVPGDARSLLRISHEDSIQSWRATPSNPHWEADFSLYREATGLGGAWHLVDEVSRETAFRILTGWGGQWGGQPDELDSVYLPP